MDSIPPYFEALGGTFILSPDNFSQKLPQIKAFVFDWDGVFNNGQKEAGGSSSFNEVDSMGINMLRFGYFLLHKKLPATAIISGEKNNAAFYLSNREHFTANYYKIGNKLEALHHFCNANNLLPFEVLYVYDDVLDLSIAQISGIRICIKRKASPLFTNYVIENALCDYTTGSEGGSFAVREVCEMLLGSYNIFNQVMLERTKFEEPYTSYLQHRNSVTTLFFTKQENQIIEKTFDEL